MAATLMMVALTASRRMNLEKVRWRLKAIRLAIKAATFKWRVVLIGKISLISQNRAEPCTPLLKSHSHEALFRLLVITVFFGRPPLCTACYRHGRFTRDRHPATVSRGQPTGLSDHPTQQYRPAR